MACLLAAAAPAVLAFGTGPASVQAQPATPELVIEGKGWGHGVGMSQDGALTMGRAGASASDILGHFYPGTGLGRATGTLRVVVLPSAGIGTLVEFPDGGRVRDDPTAEQSPGFPVEVGPGGRVELLFDGARYTARAVSGFNGQGPYPPAPPPAPDAPPPPPLPPPGTAVSARPLSAHPRQGSTTAVLASGRRYRGIVRAVPGPAGLRLVNEVDVEQYLRGMGEVRDPSWPPAALQAQAIAARTYALRTVAGGGEICDTDRCQVYLGQTAEYAAMDKAVADSAGAVVVHGNALAQTFYSASGGGISATPEEGFGPGGTSLPYLVAVPYPTDNPMAWAVRTDMGAAARRIGYRGRPAAVAVSRAGPSGRPLQVTIEGDAGSMTVDGQRFVSALGLRSNLFTIRTEAPAPPPPLAAEDDVEAEVTTAVPATEPLPVPQERLSAEGSDVGPAGALLGVLVLLVLWLGLRRGRDRAPGQMP
jgi:stage II sporulation protein D